MGESGRAVGPSFARRRLLALVGVLAGSSAGAGQQRPADRARARTGTARWRRVAVPLDRSGACRERSLCVSACCHPVRGDGEPCRCSRSRRASGSRGRWPQLGGSPNRSTANLLRGRGRLVVFDQRGTGRVGSPRAAPSLARGSAERRRGRHRRAPLRLRERIGPEDVRTTRAPSRSPTSRRCAPRVGVAAHDLYGTWATGRRLALAYAAAYPQRVERLLLDSVVAARGGRPVPRAHDRRNAAGCCDPGGRLRLPVHARSRRRSLGALATGSRTAPLRGGRLDARRARARLSRLNARRAGPGLCSPASSNGYLRVSGPRPCARAANGDACRCWHGSRDGAAASRSRVPPATAAGSLVSDVRGRARCRGLRAGHADRGARGRSSTPAMARRSRPRAFAPFGPRRRAQLGEASTAAASWPASPVAQPQSALPAVPTLIVSGELRTLRTPREDAAALAGAAPIPGACLLRVPVYGVGGGTGPPTPSPSEA